MHIHVNEFVFNGTERRAAMVGFPRREIRRVESFFAELGIELLDGGSIDDGSNMAKNARAAAAAADIVFLKVKQARTLKAEDLSSSKVVHCTSISQIKKLFENPQRRAA